METKFNKNLKKKSGFPRLRPDWQEHLPIRGMLIFLGVLAALFLFIVINLAGDSYLDPAEAAVIRARDILRVGVDTDTFGLSNKGDGLEIEITKALSLAVFGEEDACETVETTRQTAAQYLTDEKIDLAIMSLPSLNGFTATELPFYIDAVVFMGYTVPDSLEGKKIAVLYNTAAAKVLTNYLKTSEIGAEAVTYAAYYDMLVALRSGTVDCVCMTRTAALSHKQGGLVIYPGNIGTVEYHIITDTMDRTLLNVCESLLRQWIEEGTVSEWYQKYHLTY